ncbi:MAG: hypothetical protein K9G46_11615 [Flavobacteriales bacterium]|jgi:hypothetical protein|nr:hypothetical protein [Flavobacteriales bacterium]
MAVYRFRVFIEDDHEVFRDIDVQGKQRFADLHKQIVQSFNFEMGQPAEYFSSDQQWYEGDTVVALNGKLEGDHQKIVNHINVPRQRFLCVTTSHKEVGLALELQKILQDEEGVIYPCTAKSQGEPPYYTQPPPEPIIDSHSDHSSVEDEEDVFEDDGPSEDEIDRIQKEAEVASKKADFKAPSIDFSKLGALSDDDDEEEDEDDDDSDDEDGGGGFDDFSMDDL